MAWNEPGNGKNPWDRSGGNQGPPDLDEIVRNLQRRMSSLFGGRRNRPDSGGMGSVGAGLIAVVALAIWAATGIYKVDASERGVVLRFGEYHTSTLPGLHWHIPVPIENVEVVNVTNVDRFPLQTRMLTADENIVVVDLAVQFRRADPRAYLFNVREPLETLRDAAESAIREVVGKNKMDFILREGRAEIALQTRDLMQLILDSYETGLEITTVNLQDANFPAQVQSSVQDAIKAREDKERLDLEAQSYANDILPKARGAAARQTEDAAAYRARVIADAEGEASRFSQLLAEYEKAPEVTRERLYIETLEQVMGSSNKVLLDAEGSGNLIYLPVDKLLEGRSSARDNLRSGAGSSGSGDAQRDAGERRPRGSR